MRDSWDMQRIMWCWMGKTWKILKFCRRKEYMGQTDTEWATRRRTTDEDQETGPWLEDSEMLDGWRGGKYPHYGGKFGSKGGGNRGKNVLTWLHREQEMGGNQNIRIIVLYTAVRYPTGFTSLIPFFSEQGVRLKFVYYKPCQLCPLDIF